MLVFSARAYINLVNFSSPSTPSPKLGKPSTYKLLRRNPRVRFINIIVSIEKS